MISIGIIYIHLIRSIYIHIYTSKPLVLRLKEQSDEQLADFEKQCADLASRPNQNLEMGWDVNSYLHVPAIFSNTFSKKTKLLPFGPGESRATCSSSGQGGGERVEEGAGGRVTSDRLGIGFDLSKMRPWQTQKRVEF